MDSTDILINIRKIVRSINLESKRIQKDYGVSIPQVLCLNYLSNCPNQQSTQSEIKSFLNLNSSTASGIVQRLEKKGLIAKLPKSGDKRVTKLILTAYGDQLLKRIPPLMHDRMNTKLQKMNPSEVSEIVELLEKLVLLLQISELDASEAMTDELVI
ncbi:MarR family winged helix-turn-helix transcriptional regulator [Roseimarinus sediminis]|jgi:DNA-binding MarR family transcriptional regulator|uniref:MarR family winged helix-turn-helix transcriptional regulator n=1 Tax=Roseimarinus sediminis TaxID=1610899 RepID=UPI003D1C8B5A